MPRFLCFATVVASAVIAVCAAARSSEAPAALTLVLNYRHADELDRLVRLQAQPGSALYGHFLTPAQFDAYFAPDAASEASVARALGDAGLHIVRAYEDRTVLDVAGTSRAAERFLTGAVSGQLRALIRDVRGSSPRVSSRAVSAGARYVRSDTHFRGPDGGLSPTTLAAAYDFPVEDGSDGSGRATGMVAPSALAQSDLASFANFFGLSRVKLTSIAVDGGGKYSPKTPETQTATLVAEAIAGTAPGTHLVLYDIPDLSEGSILDAYARADSDAMVDVLDSSFAACEIGTSFADDADALAEQGESEGMTFVASSGDDGSAECGTPHGGQAAPASSPHFVAVGGTHLKVSRTQGYVSETGWRGSGGGVSRRFALPSYQNGLAGASPRGRNVPDLAFDADPNDGMSLSLAGSWDGPAAGTELAAALFAALQTEIDQVQNKRFGYVNPLLYAVFANDGYSLFRDIVHGSNGGYSAAPGYDNVTGIGSPLGNALAGAL